MAQRSSATSLLDDLAPFDDKQTVREVSITSPSNCTCANINRHVSHPQFNIYDSGTSGDHHAICGWVQLIYVICKGAHLSTLAHTSLFFCFLHFTSRPLKFILIDFTSPLSALGLQCSDTLPSSLPADRPTIPLPFPSSASPPFP